MDDASAPRARKAHGMHGAKLKKPTMEEEEPAGRGSCRSIPPHHGKAQPTRTKTYLLVNHARLESGIAMQEIKQVKKQDIYL
jgi:hypothetical protein